MLQNASPPTRVNWNEQYYSGKIKEDGKQGSANVKHVTLSNGIAGPHNGALQLATAGDFPRILV